MSFVFHDGVMLLIKPPGLEGKCRSCLTRLIKIPEHHTTAVRGEVHQWKCSIFALNHTLSAPRADC